LFKILNWQSHLVSWNQSSFKKMQPMAAAEIALKSPLIPLFSKGELLNCGFNPLWKRGEGEISTRRYGNYLTNFNSRTVANRYVQPRIANKTSNTGIGTPNCRATLVLSS